MTRYPSPRCNLGFVQGFAVHNQQVQVLLYSRVAQKQLRVTEWSRNAVRTQMQVGDYAKLQPFISSSCLSRSPTGNGRTGPGSSCPQIPIHPPWLIRRPKSLWLCNGAAAKWLAVRRARQDDQRQAQQQILWSGCLSARHEYAAKFVMISTTATPKNFQQKRHVLTVFSLHNHRKELVFYSI